MAKTTAQKVISTYAGKRDAIIARRNSALSTFRATAEELTSINDELDADAREAQELIEFLTARKNEALRGKADNEAVISRIYEIIGE